MSTLLRLVDLMDAKVCTGEWGTGWQVSLRSASGLDEDLSGGVDGRLVPVATDTRFCVYCAGKPVTALCVGAIIDRGKLALDDVLGDLIEGIADPSLAVVTVDELLQHTAGLGRFPASAFLAQPVAKRDRLLRNIVPQAPRPPATTYSEFVAWELLRFAIEAASGEPFETVVAASVLDALGLPDEIVYTMSPANAETLGLNVAVRGALIEPLLWELSDTNLTECKASTGLITSARSPKCTSASPRRSGKWVTSPLATRCSESLSPAPRTRRTIRCLTGPASWHADSWSTSRATCSDP